jgi:hypothetical protein
MTAGSKQWTFTQATGVLTVGAAPSGYASWASANAGGQTADLDYDNDGVANGVEFFMGQTGSGFTANPPLVGDTVTWPKSAGFVGSYKVETSTDLVIWTDVTGHRGGQRNLRFLRRCPPAIPSSSSTSW